MVYFWFWREQFANQCLLALRRRMDELVLGDNKFWQRKRMHLHSEQLSSINYLVSYKTAGVISRDEHRSAGRMTLAPIKASGEADSPLSRRDVFPHERCWPKDDRVPAGSVHLVLRTLASEHRLFLLSHHLRYRATHPLSALPSKPAQRYIAQDPCHQSARPWPQSVQMVDRGCQTATRRAINLECLSV